MAGDLNDIITERRDSCRLERSLNDPYSVKLLPWFNQKCLQTFAAKGIKKTGYGQLIR